MESGTMSESDIDLDDALEVAVQAARGAGEIIRNTFRIGIQDQVKTETDPVTATDYACEALVFKAVKARFPTFEFLGEESHDGEGSKDGYNMTDAPTWVCDPVDGTANFLHGVAWTCVSIGLVVSKTPVLGVVYNPISEEMFTAVRGKGARLNGDLIKGADQQQLSKAMICTEFGANRDPQVLDLKLSVVGKVVAAPVQAVRCLGSAALNMCSVACGRLDGYYEWGMHAWDVAAASVVCQEAGVVVSDLDGSSFSICDRRVLVACRGIHQPLKDLLVEAGVPPIGPQGS